MLICSDGRCVLTDFGVARMPTDVQLTTPGMVLGSPHFISPERAMGSDFGPPSDLFSLGVTLYTAIEGRPPFDKGDPIETMHAVVEDPPAPAQRAGSLTPVLMGLLEKDPAQRFDVPTARTMLRQQLAGPLASKSPPHMMTDPYSVVPSQRPAAAATQAIPPTPAQPPKPSGQIGGRAMLAPGESLSGHLAKIKKGASPGGRRRAKEEPPALTDPMSGDPTSVIPPRGTGGDPTSLFPSRGRGGDPTSVLPSRGAGGDPTSVIPPHGASGDRTSVIPPRPMGGDTTSVIPPRAAWNGAQAARQPLPGTVVGGGGAKAKLDTAVRSVQATTGRAVQTVQGWPRNKQLIAGGMAAAVLILLVLVFTLPGGDDNTTPTAQSSDEATVPIALDTQDYKGKGITVKVPKGWTKKSADNWVDYVDPQDSGRKVRILVEQGSATPARFAEIAENTLQKSKNCPDPYNRVGISDVQVAGHDGSQLEYTCGGGDTMRHGIWQETTVSGKMFSFYLTSNESDFATSKGIFDEMTKTFTFESA